MATYEELLERAVAGTITDAEADELRKFGGSNLRDQLEASNAKLKENEAFIREGRFRTLVEQNSIEGLLLSDLDGVSTDDISADLLRQRAESKREARNALLMEHASASGFESVEEYEAAMAELSNKKGQARQAAEVIGGATSTTGSGTRVPTPVKDPYDEAVEHFKEAVKQGATHDVAMGEATHSLMARQHPDSEGA